MAENSKSYQRIVANEDLSIAIAYEQDTSYDLSQIINKLRNNAKQAIKGE